MQLNGKQVKNTSIEQSKLNIPTDSITSISTVTNAEYVNIDSVNKVNEINYTTLNLGMTANIATIGDIACDTHIIEFPISSIQVKVNNVNVTVGETADCYFSPDGGTTIRIGGNALKGDYLYWNSSRFDLENDDKIDFIYIVSKNIITLEAGSTHIADPINQLINVKYIGETGTTMTFIIDDVSFTVGNSGGTFVWDVGGLNEHVFTFSGESWLQTVNEFDYTIWFDGFGSLLFSYKKGNYYVSVNKPMVLELVTTAINTDIEIPHDGGVFDYEVNWGDGSPVSKVTSYNDNNRKHTYENIGTYTVTLTGKVANIVSDSGDYKFVNYLTKVKSLGNIVYDKLQFSYCNKLTNFESGNFGAKLNNAYAMFKNSNLTLVDFGNLDTSDNLDTRNMFEGCGMTSLDLRKLDMSNIQLVNEMFKATPNLTTLDTTGWDTSNFTDLTFMFYNCGLPTLDISHWNLNKVNSLTSMFYDNDYITSVTLPNIISDVDLTTFRMFYGCNNLVSIYGMENWDANLTNANSMFSTCTSLTSIDLSNTKLSELTNTVKMFYNCTTLTSIDLSNTTMDNVVDSSGMFYNCTALTSLQLPTSGFGLSTNFSTMFGRLSSLTSLDITNLDTTSGESFDLMFYNTAFTTLDVSNLNTSNATSMTRMFSSNAYLTSLILGGTFNTSNVTEADFMFDTNKTLTSLDITACDFGNVTNATSMFANLRELTTLDVSQSNFISLEVVTNIFNNSKKILNLDLTSWGTSNITDTTSMFYSMYGLTSLNISGCDFSNVTNTTSMFQHCEALTTLNTAGCDFSSLTNGAQMFMYNHLLQNIDLSMFDNSPFTNTSYMFYQCNTMTDIDISGFGMSVVTNVSNMFRGCTSVTTAIDDTQFWNRLPSAPTSHSNCFTDNTNRTNYETVPTGWY